ncbi:hypothetical protein TNCV_5083351 [Trichonephila clavipes]|nr:hypothetical protein TNCV_5083351 [Trichonephila clavipes]
MVYLDTNTRWNSLLAMLEGFLEIKSVILKQKEEQMMTNVEFETVTTIVAGSQRVVPSSPEKSAKNIKEVKIILDRVISDRKERERSKQEEREREREERMAREARQHELELRKLELSQQIQPLNDESGRRVEIGPLRFN